MSSTSAWRPSPGGCHRLTASGGDQGLWLLVIGSSLLGIGVTLSIGGADMPVVISLLNSYSGVAAAAAGFVVGSQMLIVAGAMVGAAGLILTQVMCNAMNRSLVNVLFGGALGASASAADQGEYQGITSCSAGRMRLTLETAQRVVFVLATAWRWPGPSTSCGSGRAAGSPRH